MDPDTALRQFDEARRDYWVSESGTAEELFAAMNAIQSAEALIDWLAKGGVAPDWSKRTK